MEKNEKGGGLGTTLALAALVVVIAVAAGVGLARYGSGLPVVGWLFGEGQPRTTASPVVVERVQKLDRLATVRMTEHDGVRGGYQEHRRERAAALPDRGRGPTDRRR
ncbi:MAG: hypothetical protein M3157_03770 [Actinomycetota bacterium]|nr:hypothetical protein [Actinomycetota bacterium]